VGCSTVTNLGRSNALRADIEVANSVLARLGHRGHGILACDVHVRPTGWVARALQRQIRTERVGVAVTVNRVFDAVDRHAAGVVDGGASRRCFVINLEAVVGAKLSRKGLAIVSILHIWTRAFNARLALLHTCISLGVFKLAHAVATIPASLVPIVTAT
jgi:hypothetical protein